MNRAGQVKLVGYKLHFVFRLPARHVEFSGLFLTLYREDPDQTASSEAV